MDKKYYITIGLEIHAEVKTETKMFCSCLNNPDEEKPNVNICPVCMAHPGTLPVPNKKAIEKVIKVGLALGSSIADFSEFDRKNYFYPDIPKGYQISQFKYPIVSGGSLANMQITRIHLEEDTGTSKHDKGDYSLVDFNRAGVPLMELVTDAHTFEDAETASKTASNFAKEYQLLLWYLGVSDANMEKGEMRVEANVSISPDKDKKWTAYVEVKNLNSFKSVEKAIKYEVERMTKLFEEGRESEIVKETRGWDEVKQMTISQRRKESSEDYRYFPDPDIPKMKLHEVFNLEEMKKNLPELPEQKRNRYRQIWSDFYENRHTLDFTDVEYDKKINFFIENFDMASFFDYLTKEWNLEIKDNKFAQNLVNAFTNDINPLKIKYTDIVFPGKFTSENLNKLFKIKEDGMLVNVNYKEILDYLYREGGDPLEYAKENNLLQTNNEDEIKTIVEKIISENPEVVATYKGGKENAIMSLVGKVIKESGGSANPQMVIKLLKELL